MMFMHSFLLGLSIVEQKERSKSWEDEVKKLVDSRRSVLWKKGGAAAAQRLILELVLKTTKIILRLEV